MHIIDQIKERMAADAAAGVVREYPQHRGKAKLASVPGRTPLPVYTPCAYEGAVLESCKTCGGEGRHVRDCEVHDRCTRSYVAGLTASCDRCEDRIPATADPLIIEADRFARDIPSYPADRYSGSGIVIVGGGKYLPGAYVAVKMLRHLGCALPVEVWYLGAAEYDGRIMERLEHMGVRPVDALAHPAAAATRGLTGFPDSSARNDPNTKHPPYQVKSFAALHSRFKEVLVLDADNYACVDPTVLFSEPRYRETGAVFWPDRVETIPWTKWGDWGVNEFGPKAGLEVGQYILDKAQVWEPLNLMRWYDDRGDWCYGWGQHHDHGDKGPPRVAWAKFRRLYTMYALEPGWNGWAFTQVGPDGVTPMFVHRCQSKFVIEEKAFTSSPQLGANLRGSLPLEDAAFSYLDELRRLLA